MRCYGDLSCAATTRIPTSGYRYLPLPLSHRLCPDYVWFVFDFDIVVVLHALKALINHGYSKMRWVAVNR